MKFDGAYTALVTPFKDGAVDEQAFEELIQRQIAAGITGIVPVGTTGESPTLSHEEHGQVVALAVKYAAGRCQVIAGTGSNSTQEAVSLTQEAEKLGVDGALLVAPYYNKPSQEGLYRHYRAIAESTGVDLILYSIPGRCGVEIGVDTVARLAADCKNIVAIKEAGGDVERVSLLREVLPESFGVLSGDDSMTVPFMSVGARGVISVASNLVPEVVVNLVKAGLSGDFQEARGIHQKYFRLFKDLFLETNPVPIKQALAWKWGGSAECRLPLWEMSSGNQERLKNLLKKLEILG